MLRICSVVRNSSNEFFIVRFIILELCPGPLEDLDRFIEMIRLSSTILSFIILENRAWTRKVAKKEVFFFKIKYDLSFIILKNRAWTSPKWVHMQISSLGARTPWQARNLFVAPFCSATPQTRNLAVVKHSKSAQLELSKL